jgi:FKBP-type peptidyl-prolyl cis-trans isomerase FkpA
MKLMQLNGLISIVLVLLITTIISCGPATVNEYKPANDTTGEVYVRVNKYLVKKDADIIKSYIKRHKWDMTETESGLWFQIYKQGNGKNVKKGDKAILKYTSELLDGTPCYSSDSLGFKQFVIGEGRVEAGIDEGVLYMKKGDVARFILPPHLAYGLMGDENKIPARATLVYNVELLDIK